MKSFDKIIKKLYLALFLFTPFLFTFQNSELFEIPKIYFVYFITTIICFFHLINWIKGNAPLFKKNYLNLFLLFFLGSQVICTLTSIDTHTSFFGYYSRLNGGLLSTICYLLLYQVLVVYLDEKHKSAIINISMFTGLIVSIYGILEHFGIDKNLWVQDVQSRVFSTLGQPNWLAAYLCIILPLSAYKFITSSSKKASFLYFFQVATYFTCLLFTKSKSGILAAIVSLSLLFIISFFNKKIPKKLIIFNYSLIIVLLFFINNPIKDLVSPKKPPFYDTSSNSLLITPSSDIRKIVWKGSLDLFKKFPLFGTGVETFAYSYYWTRPLEHNLTSEWDFIYNKAHNEYLNFLATTGLIGSIPYLALIIATLLLFLKNILKTKHQGFNSALFASYLSILITNGFGFSVVITSLYFFLIPSLLFNNKNINFKSNSKKYQKLSIFIILLIFIITNKKIISFYLADIYFAKYETSNDHQEYQKSYQYITKSIDLRPSEPNYLVHGAISAAKMALLTQDQNYINQVEEFSQKATEISPSNINFLKQKAQAYYYLAAIDSKYLINTVEFMLQANKLAPTDAKIVYTLGQFLESAGLVDDALYYYQESVSLKPNYDHAYFALGKIYYNQKQYQLAKTNLELNLKYAPNNTESQEMLNEISKLIQ